MHTAMGASVCASELNQDFPAATEPQVLRRRQALGLSYCRLGAVRTLVCLDQYSRYVQDDGDV